MCDLCCGIVRKTSDSQCQATALMPTEPTVLLGYREVHHEDKRVKGGQRESIEFAADERCSWRMTGAPLE